MVQNGEKTTYFDGRHWNFLIHWDYEFAKTSPALNTCRFFHVCLVLEHSGEVCFQKDDIS